MNDPAPSFHPATSRPKLEFPPGACDARRQLLLLDNPKRF